MTSSKFESLWKFMSIHNLIIDGEPPPGVLCSLCSKLMIEPYAAECGCQFCGKCIKDYLEDESKKCLKVGNGCCEEILKIDVNVFKDVRTYQIIKKVIIKCPYENCDVSTELEKMEEHFHNCSTRWNICPFKALGCGNDVIVDVNEHLKEETFHHSQLLTETINELKKKIHDLSMRDEEMKILKKEGEINKKELENHRQEINMLKEEEESNKECIKTLTEEVKEKEISIKEMKIKIIELETKIISQKYEDINHNLEEMKKILEIMGIDINELKDQEKKSGVEHLLKKEILNENHLERNVTQHSIFEIANGTQEGEKVERILTDKNETKNEEIKVDNVEKEIVNAETEGSHLNIEIQEKSVEDVKNKPDFVWMITNFTEKKKKATLSHTFYNSNPFYKDNYKLSLSCRITELEQLNKNLYLELYLVIMKGEQDDSLEWPMKQMINISIMNQTKTCIHKTGKYSYESYKGRTSYFDKPKKEMNKGIGGLSIAVKDIESIYGLLLKDSILVCCSLDSVPS